MINTHFTRFIPEDSSINPEKLISTYINSYPHTFNTEAIELTAVNSQGDAFPIQLTANEMMINEVAV